MPHRFANDGDEDAVAIPEFRPALRTAEFFQRYFDLAQRGELDHQGKPTLLRCALLGSGFAAESGDERAAPGRLQPVAAERDPVGGRDG